MFNESLFEYGVQDRRKSKQNVHCWSPNKMSSPNKFLQVGILTWTLRWTKIVDLQHRDYMCVCMCATMPDIHFDPAIFGLYTVENWQKMEVEAKSCLLLLLWSSPYPTPLLVVVVGFNIAPVEVATSCLLPLLLAACCWWHGREIKTDAGSSVATLLNAFEYRDIQKYRGLQKCRELQKNQAGFLEQCGFLTIHWNRGKCIETGKP